MTNLMICLTKDCQRTEALLRDMVHAAQARLSHQRGSSDDLKAAINRAQQYLDRNEKFIDSRPGHDD